MRLEMTPELTSAMTGAACCGASKSALDAHYEACVESLGGRDFSRTLFEWVACAVPIDEISGFSLPEEKSPRTIVSHGIGAEAFHRANLYQERYFRLDPFRRAYRLIGDGRAVRMKALPAAIADREYRHECFERPRLGEKLSFLRKAKAGEPIIFSIYRAAGRPALSPEEERRIGALCDLIMPLLRKHAAIATPPERERCARQIEEAVAALAAGLTAREQQVLARTLIGDTAQAIGRDLRIGATTVLTYRRRAYARLGVSSASQLIPRLLQ